MLKFYSFSRIDGIGSIEYTLSLLFCNVLVTSISPFPLVGSQLFARGMNLD